MPTVNVRLDIGELRAEISQLSEGVLDDVHFNTLVGSVCDVMWRSGTTKQVDYIGAFSRMCNYKREWIISNAGAQRAMVIAVELFLKRSMAIAGLDFGNSLMHRYVTPQGYMLDLTIIVPTITAGVI